MNTSDYLAHINYQGSESINLEVLQSLQFHHLLKVPFENLNIHYNRPIELDVEQFYKKVVEEKRGGFCYELNGLFQTLLNDLGFQTILISATVYGKEKGAYTKANGHATIIVILDQSEYLVDVGFGEFAFNPLLIEIGKVQEDPRGLFVIEKENEWHVVYKITNDVKAIEYRFTKEARQLSSFQEMCIYQQTSPDSHFTAKKLISRPTSNGRITLTNDTLKITDKINGPKIVEFPKEMFKKYLYDWFELEESKLSGSHR